MNFLDHDFGLWDPCPVSFLDHGLVLGVHVQLVAHDLGADARHFVGSLCENLLVL